MRAGGFIIFHYSHEHSLMAYGHIAHAQLLAQYDNHAQVLRKQTMTATKYYFREIISPRVSTLGKIAKFYIHEI